MSVSPLWVGRSSRAGRHASTPPPSPVPSWGAPRGLQTGFPARLSEQVIGKSLRHRGFLPTFQATLAAQLSGDGSERSLALAGVSFLAWGQCASAQKPCALTAHLPLAGATSCSSRTVCAALGNAFPSATGRPPPVICSVTLNAIVPPVVWSRLSVCPLTGMPPSGGGLGLLYPKLPPVVPALPERWWH